MPERHRPIHAYRSTNYIYEVIDMVLIMSINPSFGGQKFLSLAYPKIEDTRRLLDPCAHGADSGRWRYHTVEPLELWLGPGHDQTD